MTHLRLFLTATVLGTCGVALGSEEARPNLLFLFADDWGRYAGIYAESEDRPSPNQVVATPNIDQVGRDGVVFRNAFVTAPSCTPCRSSLLSGQYFYRTGLGAILQGAQWDPEIPSFPLLLRDAGYQIGKSYKVWSPGTPADAPFGGSTYAYQKAGGAFNSFSQNVTRRVEQGASVEEAKQELYDQVRANFADFLADREEGRPFLYWFGPTNVHRKWVKGSGKALWGIDPEALEGRLPAFLPDVPEVREDFADYLGEIQAFDAAVGLLLGMVEESGERERTMVVISGDHGAPGFPGGKCNLYDFGTGVPLVALWPGQPGGRVVDDFVNLMDLAPTFVEAGGVAVPEVMTGRSLVDVLKSPDSGQVDPKRTFVVTGRERHVGQARDENRPYPQRALRTEDFLYIRNLEPDRWPMGGPGAVTDSEAPPIDELENETFVAFADMDASPTKAWLVENRGDPTWAWHYRYAFAKRPGEELFDLRRDPDQMTNVADDPAYAGAKARLAGRLMEILTETGDPRVLGDGKMFERPPFTDVPEPRRQPAAR